MADKEISELTAATTPLAGTELIHIDQGGNSRKVALTDVAAITTGAMLKATYDPNDDGIIAVAQGGTNSATASGARTNLGLGTMAVQNAATVAITGGSVTGITDITVADGGTGASDASGARTNLGLAIGADVMAYSANLAGFAATTVANVLNRVNHTGTQLAATISDFSTAADLRITAAIGSTVQAWSDNLDGWSALEPSAKQDESALLTSISALSLTAGDLIYATSATTVARLPVGTNGQVLALQDGVPQWDTELSVGGLLAANNLSDVASATTTRTNIGAQAASANLTTLADTTVAATTAALKALDTADSSKVALTEEGKTGDWNLLTGDYSAHVAGDPGGAFWLKADDSLASAKAWRRARDFAEGVPIDFFGAQDGDATKDTQAVADAALWAADDSDKKYGAEIIYGPRIHRIGETIRLSTPITNRGVGGAFMNQFSSTQQIFNGSVLQLESGVNANMFECWLDPTKFALFQDFRGFMTFRGLLLNGNRSLNGNHPHTDLNSTGHGIVAKGTRYITIDDCTVMMFAQDGFFCENYDYGPDQFSMIFNSLQVSVASDFISISGLVASDIPTGTAIRFTTAGTLPSPLTVATTYYVIERSSNSIQVAASLSDALAGTEINLTTQGSGTSTINRYSLGFVNNLDIHNSRFHNNGRRGLDVQAGDASVCGNSVGYNGTDGIRSIGTSILGHNYVWNNGGNGIVVSGLADGVVIGNKSYDNQKSGFVLSSDLPGGLVTSNMALRNNAATVANTDPIDSSGFYIGTDSTSLVLTNNLSHNLYGSNVKQQKYGFYFNDADCIAQFDGSAAEGNVTQDIVKAAETNTKFSNTSSGKWTPTLTSVANVAASTAFEAKWSRVGNQVRCWGRVTIDPTAGTDTTTSLGISLPIASAFTAADDCRGTAAASTAQRAGFIVADTTNDRAQLTFASETTANTDFAFQFDYEVI